MPGTAPATPAADPTLAPQGDQIPSLKPPQPENFVERLTGLAKVHPWMPHQTVATLAALPASDQMVAQMAGALRSAYGQVDKSIHYITDDPLLQKSPSLGLALKEYLSGTVGPWPIQDSDLVHVQKQLMAHYGMGGGGLGEQGSALKADGVWNSQWNALYTQYVQDSRTAALGGGQAGSTPVSAVLGFLNSLLPKEAASAVVAWAKSVPNAAMTDLHTIAGSVGGTAANLSQPGVFVRNPLHPLTGAEAQRENAGSAAVENAIPGSHVTPQTSFTAGGNRSALERTAQVVGDMFLTHGVFGAGRTIAQAAGETAITGLDRTAAERGPGVIAKSLYDTTAKDATGKVGGIVPATPILKYTGPVVDKLAGEDGLYYRARSLLAAPYQYGPVRLAGTAVGQLGVQGAKTRGVAGLENAIGGQTSPLQQQINQTDKYANALDEAVQNKLAFTVLGHHIRPGIDTIAWFLHPPLSGPASVSGSVGADLGNAHAALNDALGPSTGFAASIERGINGANTGKHMDYQDLIDHFGGETNFYKWVLPKIAQHAAGHYADNELRLTYAKGPEGMEEIANAGGRTAFLKQVANELRSDPDKLVEAMMQFATNENPVSGQWGGPDELAQRIAAEILRSNDGRRGWLKDNGQNWVKAGDIMRDTVIPRMAEVMHDPVKRGSVGLANLDYKAKHVAEAEASALEARYNDAKSALTDESLSREARAQAFDDLNTSVSDMKNWLFHNMDVDAARMPLDHQQLIDLMHKEAEGQSAAIFLKGHSSTSSTSNELDFSKGMETPGLKSVTSTQTIQGASPQLRQAFKDLHELGYQPVMGNDIGHAFYDQPHLDIFDGRLTKLRRMVEKAGLSPENIGTHDIGWWFQHYVKLNLQEAVGNGELRLMPYHTTQTIMSKLRDEAVIPSTPGFATALMNYGPGHWSYKANLEKITQELLPKVKAEAEAMGKNPSARDIEKEATRQAQAKISARLDNPMGLLQISPKQVRDALKMATGEMEDTASGVELQRRADLGDVHAKKYADSYGYDAHASQVIYRAIQKAKNDLPWRLTGWQGIENMAAYRLGFAGRTMPESNLARLIENLPTRYVPVRNRLRFTLSPEFSLRRWAKANVKGALDGVPPTLSPLRAMHQRGIAEQALATLDRVMPEWKDPIYDEGVQSLYAEDVFGIFNPRNTEARAAWYWEKMDKTDSEIRQLLIKNFGYGSAKYGEGRTAMERSLNFVFFPFSFDKTLYRNTGAYLLDRPAQRMMLTAGLAAYHQWNDQHPHGDVIGTSSWFQKHVPLAQEALRLNAFAHGLSPGQPGGINAPLLNLFLPQSIVANKQGLATVQGMIPVIKELQNFGQELADTGRIGQIELMNIGKGPGTVWKPQVVAETKQAQSYDAYTYRRELDTALHPQINYNAHHSDKIKVPNNPQVYGDYAGQVINATMVNKLTHAKYPAFQIQDPAVYYDNAAAAITQYSDKMRLGGHPVIAEWITDAQKYGNAIYNGKIDTGAQEQATKVLRNYAIRFAETVPGFLSFYNQYFRWQYGPLEAVSHG